MMTSTWNSIPWAPVGDTKAILHKRRVPYIPNATYLQTLDIWVPVEGGEVSGSAPDPSTSVPHRKGPWVVYIHGGAWRDPLVDSSSFEPAALSLLGKIHLGGLPSIAGIASLNYRLSHHPKHPTHPSPPRDATAPPDVARTAKHPEHISDVLSGLSYLSTIGALSEGYILAGHSCGAMLAFQVVMRQERWGLNVPITIKKPSVVVGLNGLYDLPAFLRNPDQSHVSMIPIYDAFTRGAFGQGTDSWATVCPTIVDDWKTEWPEGEQVILAQSHGDELVPYSQTEIMKRNLASRGAQLVVQEVPASGKHNEMWQRPEELVNILLEVGESF
ncbi:hypothetical protein ACJZ2D_011427 [Fusarium nematophilum]